MLAPTLMKGEQIMTKARARERAKAKAGEKAKKKRAAIAAKSEQKGPPPGRFDQGNSTIKSPTSSDAKNAGGARRGAARSR